MTSNFMLVYTGFTENKKHPPLELEVKYLCIFCEFAVTVYFNKCSSVLFTVVF